MQVELKILLAAVVLISVIVSGMLTYVITSKRRRPSPGEDFNLHGDTTHGSLGDSPHWDSHHSRDFGDSQYGGDSGDSDCGGDGGGSDD